MKKTALFLSMLVLLALVLSPMAMAAGEVYTGGEGMSPIAKLAIMIVLPLLIATVVCLIWKGQMKSAVAARTADRYIPQNGFQLTEKEDRYLYKTQRRRKIEKNSSDG